MSKPIRLCALSDTHGLDFTIPDCDIIIAILKEIRGGMPPRAFLPTITRSNKNGEFYSIKNPLLRTPFCPIMFTV